MNGANRSLAGGAALILSVMLACSEQPTSPGGLMPVCHRSGASGIVMEMDTAELSTHRSHGDYPVNLIVNKSTSVTGDSIHFKRIGDAVAIARSVRVTRNEAEAAACRITINVGPGLFAGSVAESSDPAMERFPIVIDVPDISLRGSFRMTADAGGRATGLGEGTDSTILAASPGLLTVFTGGIAQNNRAQPIIVVNAHPEGSKGNGVLVEGFTFRSGNSAADATVGGHAIFSMRATGLTVRGNRFEGGFSEVLDLRVGSGKVERNYLTGRGGSCAICLSGPGEYEARDNRIMGPGGIPGIFVNSTNLIPVPPEVEPNVLPASATVTATLTNNEVRSHQATPVGVGIRIGPIGPGSPNVAGVARVTVEGNSLLNNRFGIIAEAAFPIANTTLRGDIDLTLKNNTITGSCQTDIFVSFSRHTTGLGIQNAPYLRNSSFNLSLGTGVNWADVWYAHPAGMGNTLTVDGQVIANGSQIRYDAAKVCTGG